MFLSFLRYLLCRPSNYAHYDSLDTIDTPAWPTVSLPPAPSPISRLPTELLDLIIAYVDSTTLAACSLVCARWVAPSRARIFPRLSISLFNAHRFSVLFTEPSRVTFVSHVREIELDDSITGDFWTSQVLPKYLRQFPRLHTLKLLGNVPLCLPSGFDVITRLEFTSRVRLPSWGVVTRDELAEFIASSFPRLEELKLTQEHAVYVNFRDSVASLTPPPPNLWRVELDNVQLLPWLASGTPAPPIQFLRLDISRVDTLKALECLRHLSPSLRELELILSDIEVGAAFLHHSYIPPLPHLTSLALQAHHTHAIQNLLTLLPTCSSSSLTTLSLAFAIPYLDDDDGAFLLPTTSPHHNTLGSNTITTTTPLPFPTLDHALTSLPLLTLFTPAKVLVSPAGWRSRLNQRAPLPLEARMPLCCARGLFPGSRSGGGIRGGGVRCGGGEGSEMGGERSRPPSRAAAGSPRLRHLTELGELCAL
ncbi:F-box domain-containing protein [Favolaschia claudopus]|uniref:F-box domain-containing protein n=1 Tax=Favolaschia claudopus TaxID=2862362 RepID=A0AAW0DRB2_9AGAR